MELFLEAPAEAPEEIVPDLDATDNPLHDEQEGRHFHGCHDCCCYLPLDVTCGAHVLSGRAATWGTGEVCPGIADSPDRRPGQRWSGLRGRDRTARSGGFAGGWLSIPLIPPP